jgi:CHAT domain-containing protein
MNIKYLLALAIASTILLPASAKNTAPDRSLATPQTTAKQTNPLQNYAREINQRGAAALAAGNGELALSSWKEAHRIYTQIGDREGAIGTKINQAQALQSLGFYRQSLTTLQGVNTNLQKQPDSQLKLRGLIGLGNSLRSLRIIEKSPKYPVGAKDILFQASQLATKLGDTGAIARIDLSLGNMFQLVAVDGASKAIESYDRAAKSTDPLLRLQAKVNRYKVQSEQKIAPNTLAFLSEITADFQAAPASKGKVYAYINVAETIKKDRDENFKRQEILVPIAKFLAQAVTTARSIKDMRSESQALGALGNLYELTGQYTDAKTVTQQALILTENLPAPEISYKLNWQLGRIIKATKPNNLAPAIAAYRQSIDRLKSLRNDLNAIDTDLQFSFRDSVEPVYRELVDLLLTNGQETVPKNLSAARDAIESLQVAELSNYLRQGCLDTFTVQLDRVDRQAAVIYPIVLADRIATIASIPGKPLKYYSQSIPSADVESLVSQLRLKIENPDLSDKEQRSFQDRSQQLYNLLIAPLSADLQQSKATTLAFVLDGSLRNIPMATLYDGKSYLIEKYSIALTPGLQLFPGKSTNADRSQALLGGMSEARQQFQSLPGVKAEIDRIGTLIPNQKLLNAQFTSSQVRRNIINSNSPIVHLATHGEFSSKPEDTYILTWDGRIDLSELGNLVRNRNGQSGSSIDLLVLSACKTATGDNRATLGLAGVAIQAGAKSTIASLWSVNDEATQFLMTNLYQNLTTKNISKAESLQLAQQTLLRNPKYRSPYYWAPFILVGNWQ